MFTSEAQRRRFFALKSSQQTRRPKHQKPAITQLAESSLGTFPKIETSEENWAGLYASAKYSNDKKKQMDKTEQENVIMEQNKRKDANQPRLTERSEFKNFRKETSDLSGEKGVKENPFEKSPTKKTKSHKATKSQVGTTAGRDDVKNKIEDNYHRKFEHLNRYASQKANGGTIKQIGELTTMDDYTPTQENMNLTNLVIKSNQPKRGLRGVAPGFKNAMIGAGIETQELFGGKKKPAVEVACNEKKEKFITSSK